MNRTMPGFILYIVAIIFGAAISSSAQTLQGGQPLKVGFILTGPTNDMGWNYSHDQGRRYLEKVMKGRVQTTIVENVPENGDVERVLERMVAQGNKLIFAISYGYLEFALKVAARHPDVTIMDCGRPTSFAGLKNVGSFFTAQWEPVYVAGIVAGRMTKTNEIGYVTVRPIPVILASINAFMLGVRSVNPKAKLHVVWTNSWSDPPVEAEAVRSLKDKKVDVVMIHVSNDVAGIQTAEKQHMYVLGCDGDSRKFAPNGWLTGQYWNWGPLYVKIAQSVINHNFKPIDQRYSMQDGSVGLAPFGKVVPGTVREEALKSERQINDGSLKIFKGPLKDRNGNLCLRAGQIADFNWFNNMNFLLPGIEGSLSDHL